MENGGIINKLKLTEGHRELMTEAIAKHVAVAQDAGVSCMPWNGDGLRADLDENNKIPQANFDAACITSP